MESRTATVKLDLHKHPIEEIHELFYIIGIPFQPEPGETNPEVDHIRVLEPGIAIVQFDDKHTCDFFATFVNHFPNDPDTFSRDLVHGVPDSDMDTIIASECRKHTINDSATDLCRIESIMSYDYWKSKHADLDHDSILRFSRLVREVHVKVTKLPPAATVNDVRKFFSAFRIDDIVMEKRGVARVMFASEIDAERAVKQLKGEKLLKRAVRVQRWERFVDVHETEGQSCTMR
ncbi:hypothetical protein BDV96DRAFT_643355 [Lophiotrema nucula]|uniref:RRM domain-containing protein n=1 Tax=Lophiotrema nucula TaxID=690887 RepID=A0A6A5ZH47_9PLEO|nr:hypothetical protein BDV96DRAFT_643355 [Lophiotrema nucula]